MRELIKHITGKSGLIILLLITLLSQTAFSQSNWFWIQPKPQGNRITSIEFADRNNGCAVGDVGTIVRTTNAGQTWFTVPSPRTVDLYGVDFAKGNPNILVAVGDSGRILRSSNGGNNWYIVNTFPGVIFQDFDFATSTDGYAVGLAGKIYKTTNAGQTWAQQFSPSAASFRSVNFYDANYGIIGGDRRVMITSNGGINWFSQNLNLVQFEQAVGVACVDSMLFYAATNYDGGRVFRSTNGGVVWDTTKLNIPDQFGGSDILRHMSFGTKNNGVIACDLASIVRTSNGGNTWIRDSTFVKYYQRDYGIGIFFTTCWSDTNTAYVAGGGGNILKSANSGFNWTFSAGGFYDLHGICFVDPNTGWMVGEEGTIQKTTDGGNSWNFYPPMTREVLREVVFPSRDTGYISGDSGVVLKTTNSGNNWFMLNSGIKAFLFDIFFLNNTTGYISGGYVTGDSIGGSWIRKTIDGGINWTTLFFNPDSSAVFELNFFDESEGIALFDRSIKRTTNAGMNWITVAYGSTGSGNAMHFPTADTGYVVGSPIRAFKTTNRGQNWFTLSLSEGNVMESVHFVNSSTGYAAGFRGSVLFTSNGGANWKLINEITTTNMFEVGFADSLQGYIAGAFGTILKTTNGGVTSVSSQQLNIQPDGVELLQNYPNPFNPKTVIRFELRTNHHVRLSVYDIRGREIDILINETHSSGSYEVPFTASELSSGIYFCVLEIDHSKMKSIKMLLTK